MLQISFIILFRISLKISSLCSIYAAPSIIIPYLQFKLSSYRAIYSHAIMHKQQIIRGLRLPPCWYSLSVCNQEYSRGCSHDSHSFEWTYSEQASWNSHRKLQCIPLLHSVIYIIHALFLIMPKLFLIIPE